MLFRCLSCTTVETVDLMTMACRCSPPVTSWGQWEICDEPWSAEDEDDMRSLHPAYHAEMARAVELSHQSPSRAKSRSIMIPTGRRGSLAHDSECDIRSFDQSYSGQCQSGQGQSQDTQTGSSSLTNLSSSIGSFGKWMRNLLPNILDIAGTPPSGLSSGLSSSLSSSISGMLTQPQPARITPLLEVIDDMWIKNKQTGVVQYVKPNHVGEYAGLCNKCTYVDRTLWAIPHMCGERFQRVHHYTQAYERWMANRDSIIGTGSPHKYQVGSRETTYWFHVGPAGQRGAEFDAFLARSPDANKDQWLCRAVIANFSGVKCHCC